MSPTVSIAAFDTLGVIMTLASALSLVFNSCGFLVFLKTKSLRSPTNVFIMSLCICDIFMAMVAFIPAASCFYHGFIFLHDVCVFEGFIAFFLGLTSMYLLAAISLIRYITIAKPSPKSTITRRVALMANACCWGLGFLWSSLPIMGWNHYTTEGAGISCSVAWQSDIADTSYIIVIFIACLLIPVAVMGYSYFHVYMTIRYLRKNSSLDMGSAVRQRNFLLEKRMLKTCIVMVSVFLLSWLPYSITSLIAAFGFPHLISPLMGTIPAIAAKLSGLWNPIIYMATNKQFRVAFYKLLPCRQIRKRLLKDDTPGIREGTVIESIGNTTYPRSKKTKPTSVVPSSCGVNPKLVVGGEKSVTQDIGDIGATKQGSPSGRSGMVATTSKPCSTPIEQYNHGVVISIQNHNFEKDLRIYGQKHNTEYIRS